MVEELSEDSHKNSSGASSIFFLFHNKRLGTIIGEQFAKNFQMFCLYPFNFIFISA